MPGQNYLASYQNKRLNEVVIPGAHDAGVYTANKDNVQTQSVDIEDQAINGCRFFDLRIAAQKTTTGGVTTYTHRAFHLNEKLVRSSKVKNDPNISKHQSVGRVGGWGGTLLDMLHQAATFVQTNTTEFLILKFSKCYNWPDVARTCADVLRPAGVWYDQYGNLNTRTVQQLAGKVITVFDEKASKELNPVIAGMAPLPHGVLFFRELYDKETGRSKAYDRFYSGLQYFGKFSSTDDIKKNTSKQRKLLEANAATDIDAVGMMYWTTTALFQDIRARNDKMWTRTNVRALQATWKSGLESAITHRFGRERDDAIRLAMTTGGALGGRAKAFMPNIVMMDFVDKDKCDIVDGLNAVGGQSLQQLMIPAPRGPQAPPV